MDSPIKTNQTKKALEALWDVVSEVLECPDITQHIDNGQRRRGLAAIRLARIALGVGLPKISLSRTLNVLNCGAQNLDFVERELNPWATGEMGCTVIWENIISYLDEAEEKKEKTMREKKEHAFILGVYKQGEGEICDVVFYK